LPTERLQPYIYTAWSRGKACFSHKNSFVDFQDKTFLITYKRRYFNAFLTCIAYGKCQSDDVLLAGHKYGASPQNSASHSPICLPAELRFLEE
jgi:hypothetical protein